jgi:Flp pilus assembly pilin Flp
MMKTTSVVARQIDRFVCGSSGVAVTEYAILLALVVLTALGSIVGIGLAVEGSFANLYEYVVSVI